MFKKEYEILKRTLMVWMTCRDRDVANEIVRDMFRELATHNYPDDWPDSDEDSSFYRMLDEAKKVICCVCKNDDDVLELQWTNISEMFKVAAENVEV